jgi:hypothetical protein
MKQASAGYPSIMIVMVVVVPLLSILAALGMERLEARVLPDSPDRHRMARAHGSQLVVSYRYAPRS